MSTSHPGVYLPTSQANVFESTEMANAGWYEEGQHGGALAALVAGYVEDQPTLTTMEVSRVSLEIFRIVPLVPLRLDHSVVREGKKIQVVEIRIAGPDDEELGRATVQRLRRTNVDLPPETATPQTSFPKPLEIKPSESTTWGHGPDAKVMFHRHAVEAREIDGGYDVAGPGSLWMKVVTPIIAGREITPLQRMVVIADFCNGVSRLTTDPGVLFMNPDLTVHVLAYPSGDWVALDAESAYSRAGRGIATGTLWDEKQLVGRSVQTLFVDRT